MKQRHWHQASKTHTAIFSLIAAAIILGAGFAALYVISYFAEENFGAPTTVTSGIPSAASLPQKLLIPSISVAATIQSVGLAANGRMGIPTNFTDVAWYWPGPKPGERGSAVIDGHLDSAHDKNAVFMNLSKLKINDEIDVVDKSGQKIKFRVTDTEIYDDQNAPLGKIFDRTGSTARLNLITCDGVWNQATKNYSGRLVVYAVRVFD